MAQLNRARKFSSAISEVSSTSWRNVRFNGTTVGEVGINAALCGTWGVPVALVTGDDVVCDESSELLGPRLRTLAVKRGLGRFSARHLAPVKARDVWDELRRLALASDMREPPVLTGDPSSWTRLLDWGSTVLKHWPVDSPDAHPHVHDRF